MKTYLRVSMIGAVGLSIVDCSKKKEPTDQIVYRQDQLPSERKDRQPERGEPGFGDSVHKPVPGLTLNRSEIVNLVRKRDGSVQRLIQSIEKNPALSPEAKKEPLDLVYKECAIVLGPEEIVDLVSTSAKGELARRAAYSSIYQALISDDVEKMKAVLENTAPSYLTGYGYQRIYSQYTRTPSEFAEQLNALKDLGASEDQQGAALGLSEARDRLIREGAATASQLDELVKAANLKSDLLEQTISPHNDDSSH